MFDLTMRRTSSSSSTSSSMLSLSPTGWVPSRATVSPPSITSTLPSPEVQSRSSSPELKRAFSLELSRHELSSSQRAYAYPNWPQRDSLTPEAASPTSCYFSPNYIPNSRISDDDLAALDFTRPIRYQSQPEEAVLALSWSAINNPSSAIVPALQICERRHRLPPPPVQYRRRSSSRRSPSRKTQKTLVAIAE